MSLGSFGVLSMLERRSARRCPSPTCAGSAAATPCRPACSGCSCCRSPGSPAPRASWRSSPCSAPASRPGQVLVVIAVVSSMIAFFFYIRVIVVRCSWRTSPRSSPRWRCRRPPGRRSASRHRGGAVIVLGVVPGVLIDLAGRPRIASRADMAISSGAHRRPHPRGAERGVDLRPASSSSSSACARRSTRTCRSSSRPPATSWTRAASASAPCSCCCAGMLGGGARPTTPSSTPA
jgi:hypothetical protein